VNGTDLLRVVVARLEAAGIPFMLTGSFAAAFHGAWRATMDMAPCQYCYHKHL
jgi:hypothetical protein